VAIRTNDSEVKCNFNCMYNILLKGAFFRHNFYFLNHFFLFTIKVNNIFLYIFNSLNVIESHVVNDLLD
jgi:hypothetical protein